MSAWVALLRGINVGGHNILPMHELRRLLGELGCTDVETYIQSGNAVFRAKATKARLGAAIASAIEKNFGFAPRVHVLKAAELQSIVAANPFPAASAAPASLHVWFLAAPAKSADLARLEALRAVSERYVLTPAALYLHAPDGIGRSRLAAAVESSLGVAATARNWRTVGKIAAMSARLIS